MKESVVTNIKRKHLLQLNGLEIEAALKKKYPELANEQIEMCINRGKTCYDKLITFGAWSNDPILDITWETEDTHDSK